MRPLLLPFALLLSGPALAGAIGPLPQARTPGVLLEGLSGGTERIALSELDLERVSQSDVLFLRPLGLPAGVSLTGDPSAWLMLHGGDRVRVRVRGGAEDLLRVEVFDGVEWVVSVDRIAELCFDTRVSAEQRAGFAAPASGDLLYWIREGGSLDRVAGTLLGFGAEGPRLESSFGERTYPWGEVAALYVEALDDELQHAPSAAQPGLRAGALVGADLLDGGRVFGVLRGLTAESCTLETAPGRLLPLPLWSLAELAVDDGRARYLSELEPSSALEGSAFGDDLGLRWVHRRDRSVTGTPLMAGGVRWYRGLGVHAPSRLTWQLDGTWTGLRGAVAIDDEVLLLAARGSVVFRVLVDGESRFDSGVVRGGEPPRSLPAIDLRGARELTLEVDMDGDHFVADRADWLGLLLVREI